MRLTTTYDHNDPEAVAWAERGYQNNAVVEKALSDENYEVKWVYEITEDGNEHLFGTYP